MVDNENVFNCEDCKGMDFKYDIFDCDLLIVDFGGFLDKFVFYFLCFGDYFIICMWGFDGQWECDILYCLEENQVCGLFWFGFLVLFDEVIFSNYGFCIVFEQVGGVGLCSIMGSVVVSVQIDFEVVKNVFYLYLNFGFFCMGSDSGEEFVIFGWVLVKIDLDMGFVSVDWNQ